VVVPPRVVAPGPLATVTGYWRAISRHDYPAAYVRLAPGALPISGPQFVAYEQSIGVQRVSFSGTAAPSAASHATVVVDRLVTLDRRYGCQAWRGTYELSRVTGAWRIARATITPTRCT
jgi:hypothetical protein